MTRDLGSGLSSATDFRGTLGPCAVRGGASAPRFPVCTTQPRLVLPAFYSFGGHVICKIGNAGKEAGVPTASCLHCSSQDKTLPWKLWLQKPWVVNSRAGSSGGGGKLGL